SPAKSRVERSAPHSSWPNRPRRSIGSISRFSTGRRRSGLRASDSMRVRWILIAALASGCAQKSGSGLRARPYAVAGPADAAPVTLSRRKETLLQSPSDAFEIGVVQKLDDAASYDPFWLEAKDNALYVDPPKDLRFLDVVSAHVKRASPAEIEI